MKLSFLLTTSIALMAGASLPTSIYAQLNSADEEAMMFSPDEAGIEMASPDEIPEVASPDEPDMPEPDMTDAPVVEPDPPVVEETDAPVEETDAPVVETDAPEPDGGIVDDILGLITTAVGGVDALLGMRYIQVSATGEAEVELEGPLPEDLVNAGLYQRNYTLDLVQGRIRMDEATIHEFEALAFFPPSVITRITQNVIGEQFGSKIVSQSGTMPSSAVASLSRQIVLQNPHVLLYFALTNDFGQNITYDGRDDNDNAVLVIPDPDEVWPFRVFVNTTSGIVVKIVTRESHPLIKSRRITYRYFNWEIESGGEMPLLFPRRIRISNQDEQVIWDERRDSVLTPDEVDEEIFQFSEDVDMNSYDQDGFEYGLANSLVFETFDMVGIPYPWYAPYSEPMPLATGVTWAAAGGNSHLFVEHPDGVIVVEGFGSQFQSELMLEVTGVLFPDQQITHILQTHHHVDHSGGVREIMGAGGDDVILVVGDGITEFWEETLSKTSRIIPDAIDVSGKDTFSIVSIPADTELLLLQTDSLTVMGYSTTRDEHAVDMAFFTVETDGQKFLYQGDLYNGGLGGTVVLTGPFNLFNAMRDFGIITEDCTSDVPLTIVSMHGIPFTLEEALAELSSIEYDVGCPPL